MRTDWTQTEGPHTLCGITKQAVAEIGEIVWIELPEVGREIQAGDLVAVVESSKAAFDIYAPVAGTVVEVNTVIKSSLQPLNSDPEGHGWLYKLRALPLPITIS